MHLDNYIYILSTRVCSYFHMIILDSDLVYIYNCIIELASA